MSYVLAKLPYVELEYAASKHVTKRGEKNSRWEADHMSLFDKVVPVASRLWHSFNTILPTQQKKSYVKNGYVKTMATVLQL